MELSPENLARFPCLVVLKGEGLGMKSETTDGGEAVANSADVDTQLTVSLPHAYMCEGLVGMWLKLMVSTDDWSSLVRMFNKVEYRYTGLRW